MPSTPPARRPGPDRSPLPSASTLQVGAFGGGPTGAITGNVTDNGALNFNVTQPITYAGSVSGTGTLLQLSSSTLTLAGVNTYSGNTTVTGNGILSDTTPGSLSPNSVIGVTCRRPVERECQRDDRRSSRGDEWTRRHCLHPVRREAHHRFFQASTLPASYRVRAPSRSLRDPCRRHYPVRTPTPEARRSMRGPASVSGMKPKTRSYGIRGGSNPEQRDARS